MQDFVKFLGIKCKTPFLTISEGNSYFKKV